MQWIQSQNHHKRQPFILLSLIGLALALRGFALGFGDGQLVRPDEQNVAQAIIDHLMLPWANGEWGLNPKFFEYPSFYLYTLTPLYWVKYWLGLALGQWSTLEQYRQAYVDQPGPWFLLGRSVSAVCGSVTVALTALLTWRLTGRQLLMPVAGLMMAVVYLAVREAHFGVTDTFATMWVTAALVATALYQTSFKSGANPQNWLYGALVLAGLAASSKYPAGLVTLAPLTAFWLSPEAPRGIWEKVLQLLPLMALACGVFLLTTPFAVLDFHTFWRDFAYQMAHMANGHGLDVGMGWLRHTTFTLPVGLGWPLLGLALIALWRFVLRPKRSQWPMVIFLLAYYLWVGNTKTVFVRYMLPLVPVLCVLATLGIADIGTRVRARLPRVFKGANLSYLTIGLLCAVALLPNFQADFIFLKLLNRPDTREEAAAWLIHHVPSDQGVGVGMFLSHVQLPRSISTWTLTPQEDHTMGTNLYGRGFIQPQQWMGQQRLDMPNQWLTNSYGQPIALCQRGVAQVVLSQSPLQLYSSPPFEIEALLNHPDVRLLRTWRGLDRAASEYDAIDAFFLPYRLSMNLLDNPDNRPGPTLRLFGWDCPTVIRHFKPVSPPPQMPRINPNPAYGNPSTGAGPVPQQPQPMPTVPIPSGNGQPGLDPNHPSLPLQGAPPPPLSQYPPAAGQRLIPREVLPLPSHYRPPNGYPQLQTPQPGMPPEAMPPGMVPPGALPPELQEGYH